MIPKNGLWYEIVKTDGGKPVPLLDEEQRETEQEILGRAVQLGLPLGSDIDNARAFLEARGWVIEVLESEEAVIN
jgi:hypothetical protein